MKLLMICQFDLSDSLSWSYLIYSICSLIAVIICFDIFMQIDYILCWVWVWKYDYPHFSNIIIKSFVGAFGMGEEEDEDGWEDKYLTLLQARACHSRQLWVTLLSYSFFHLVDIVYLHNYTRMYVYSYASYPTSCVAYLT